MVLSEAEKLKIEAEEQYRMQVRSSLATDAAASISGGGTRSRNEVATESVAAAATPLFSVGLTKLIVMNVATLGIYSIYWQYKHWQIIKEREDSEILPLLRALFAPIYYYFLLGKINKAAEERGLIARSPQITLTLVYVLLFLSNIFIGSISLELDLLVWFVQFLMVPFLVILPQSVAEKVNKSSIPKYKVNARFSELNWLAIVLGIGFQVLLMLAAAAPDM